MNGLVRGSQLQRPLAPDLRIRLPALPRSGFLIGWPAPGMFFDQISHRFYPLRQFIQAGNVMKLLAASVQEIFFRFHRDLFQRLQAVGNEAGADHVDPADAFFRYLREYRPRVHVAHSQVIATSLVRGTDILTVMPWPLVEATPEREGLCTLPITEVLNEAICSIITRRGKPLSAAAQCFIDCLRSVIQRMAQSDNPADRRLFHAVDDLVP
mgnify:CR=1 FL=1